MYSKLGTVIIIAAFVFPFAVLLVKIAQDESPITSIVLAAMLLVLAATIFLATRGKARS